MDWKDNLIDDDAGIRQIVRDSKRIAVLGIKPEDHSDQPAFYVPKYLVDAGVEVVPVPVYYPGVTTILGRPVFRKLADIPGEVDLINVFRRPKDIDQHVDDMIARNPKVVWFQSGITNEAAAERLAKAGIKVVQSRCLMVDHRRHA
ncbi:MAG: CoA-binding protein [Myxococcaceae bacterium]